MEGEPKPKQWISSLSIEVGVDLQSLNLSLAVIPIRYLHLDLGKQTQRNAACFRLHSHALRVETRSWEYHDGTSDKVWLAGNSR